MSRSVSACRYVVSGVLQRLGVIGIKVNQRFSQSHAVVCQTQTQSHAVICQTQTQSHAVICQTQTQSHAVVCHAYYYQFRRGGRYQQPVTLTCMYCIGFSLYYTFDDATAAAADDDDDYDISLTTVLASRDLQTQSIFAILHKKSTFFVSIATSIQICLIVVQNIAIFKYADFCQFIEFFVYQFSKYVQKGLQWPWSGPAGVPFLACGW